jgi:membrane-associated phospholipid phosphatase
MIFGVVYMGEHYVFDVVTGIILAVIGFLIAPWLLRQVQRGLRRLLLFAKYPSLADKIPN